MIKNWINLPIAQSIGGLIEAARTSDFPTVLRGFLLSHLKIKNLVIILFFTDRPPLSLFHWIPDREGFLFEEAYLTWAYQLDPYYKQAERGGEGVFLIRDIAPDRFSQSEYGKSYFSHVQMLDELGLLTRMTDGTFVNMSLGRQQGSGRFARRDKDFLASVEPILVPLLRIYVETRLLDVPVPAPDRSAGSLARRLAVLDPQPGSTARLTPREAEVIALVMGGHSNASIAANLDISRQTVKVHRKRAYAKLNVSSQAEVFLRIMPLL